MSLYRDQQYIAGSGGADRIITMLTRDHGRIRGVAKGVRRTKSKFGAGLEPGSHIDVQLFVGKTFDTVTQVEAIENLGDVLSKDYRRWTISSAILETSERFTSQEREPALQEYRLVVDHPGASFAEDRHDPSLILDAFSPSFVGVGWLCAVDDYLLSLRKTRPSSIFFLVGGGSVCTDCRPSACATPGNGDP